MTTNQETKPSSEGRDPSSATKFERALSRLQLALSAGQLGDWDWDAQSDEVTFSERGARIFGVAHGAPLPVAVLWDMLHPDDRERVRHAVEHSLVEKADYSCEYRLSRPGGVDCWIAAKGTGVYADDGSVLGMTGLLQDVTDRRKSEESRHRLAAIVASSDDAIVSKSLDGTITSWNRGAELMFGYTAAEIVGQSVLKLIPSDRQDEEQRILKTLMKGERIEHFETVRRRKDGTPVQVSLSVSPIFDDDGNIIGASKIARDITRRKIAEERLSEESSLLNLLNETGKAIGTDLDTAVIVQKVTDAATKLTGAQFGAFFYNVENEKGESYQLFTLSGAPRAAFEKFGQPRATPLFAPTFRGEAPIRSDDVTKDPRYGAMGPHFGMPAGHLPVRSYLAVPVVSRSAEVIGGLFFGHAHVGVFTQRAENLVTGMAVQAAVAIDNARLYERVQRAAEDRKHLLEAERAARVATERVSILKDDFLATLSHELRTPLNAILGWAEVLTANPSLTRDVAESVRIIRRNAKAQAQLIEDLLDMSRIVSGKVRLDVQSLQPADVVQAAADTVHHSAELKQVRLQMILDPAAGPILGDPNRLQQCVWNLLTNAIKFTPKGGKVNVALNRVDSHVEITVSDSGRGIAPEFLPHLFERFTQADSSTTRLHGGLGLGLSIVKSLIELHGGSVHASSAGIDKGALFTLQLPLAPIDSSHWKSRFGDSSDLLSADHSKLDSLRVVAVDDERDARRLLERVLSESGATVFSGESAAKGFALVREKRPHVIISDIGMPDEDGYEFIRKVRLLPDGEGGKTPAIALSAFSRPEDRTRALRAGYQAHIVKPADPAEMIALVASLAATDRRASSESRGT